MSKFVYIFLAVFVYKLIYNVVQLLKTQYFWERYKNWIASSDPTITTYKQSIIKLFRRANVKECIFSNVEPVGFGYIATSHPKASENMFLNRAEPIMLNLLMFESCYGTYRSRIFETFSPLYWINAFLFLPKHTLSYIGLNSETFAYKLMNVVLSAVWWVALAVFALFREQWKQIAINLINQIPQ